MSDKAWVSVTYVIYSGILGFFTTGCPMYAVFVLGHNPWWMLFSLAWGTGFSPWRWYALMDGIERPYSLKSHKQNG